MFNVPLIFIDAPFQYGIKDRPEAIDYIELQLKQMIEQVGEITENRLSGISLLRRWNYLTVP
jgi:benzoyl-CoA reductase/2-hydroxyglutaryl-CoA dehydratase subunit BcrC/BadD/HgdB